MRTAWWSAAAMLLAASAAEGQQERAVFVTHVGKDTLAVEVMTREARSAKGVLHYRTPAIRVDQEVRFSAANVVEHILTTIRQGPRADSVTQRGELTFTGDSAISHAEQVAGAPAVADARFAAPAGTVPFLNLSGLSLELILRRAHTLGGDSVEVPLLITGASRPYIATVRRVAGTDSVRIAVAGVTLHARTDAAGRFLGASVPSQGVVIERAAPDSPAASWTGAAAPPSYAAPAGAPYTAEDVTIAARAGALAGTLTMPRHASGARVPAVVLVSGSGLQDRDESTPQLASWKPFRELADTLSRRGIAVLRLDDRGIGGSAKAAVLATMEDEAADVRDVVAWLRARPEVDPARVALLGHSSGGVVVPMVAAADPRLAAIVLVAAPATPMRKVSEFQIRYLFAEDTTLKPAVRDSLQRLALRQSDSAWATPGWLAQAGAYDPLPAVRRIGASVLVVHGENDRQVPVTDAGLLVKTMRDAGNRKVTLRTFSRLNHLLVDDPSGHPMRYEALPSLRVREDVRGAIAEWLARALTARAPSR